jgi:small subunit ribosomal protein S21
LKEVMVAPIRPLPAKCTTLLAFAPESLLARRFEPPCSDWPVLCSWYLVTPRAGLSPEAVEVCRFMQILVRDNNVDQALRALKKKLQREGVYREMKLRRHFEKPSEKRAREKAAAVRRARKLERKRQERDGAK